MILYEYSEEEKQQLPHQRRVVFRYLQPHLLRPCRLIRAHTLYTPRGVSLLPFSTKHTQSVS